jgi:hypothetical protein
LEQTDATSGGSIGHRFAGGHARRYFSTQTPGMPAD